MMYYSTWEDAIYSNTGTTDLVYNIYGEDQELLYTGRSIARPNAPGVEINISEIVRNYLNSDLPSSAFDGDDFNTGNAIEPNSVLSFTLTDGKGNVLEEYSFLNCWDYNTKFSNIAGSGLNYPLSIPANGKMTTGMYLFTSVYDKNARKVRTTISYPSGDTCSNGAIYYSNSLGGYDTLLLECKIVKKDNIERYTIGNKWHSGTLESGTRNINSKITESWTISTHLLNDSESEIIARELIQSNNIYLHIFADNRIVPVSITETTAEYKTRKNEKKPFYTTITLTSNQPHNRI